MGDLYVDGVGVGKNHSQALSWYKKSAAQGFPAAEYSVGAMYANGYGTKKNIGTAKQWFQKAAKNGSPKAKQALATLKQRGL